MRYPGYGTRWKFDAIKAAMDKEAWRPASEVFEGGEDYDEARSVYLGSWMGNSPSGKIYAPWSTNVTEREARKDERWRDYLEAGLAKRGLFLDEYDDGLFAAEIRPAEEVEDVA